MEEKTTGFTYTKTNFRNQPVNHITLIHKLQLLSEKHVLAVWLYRK